MVLQLHVNLYCFSSARLLLNTRSTEVEIKIRAIWRNDNGFKAESNWTFSVAFLNVDENAGSEIRHVLSTNKVNYSCDPSS